MGGICREITKFFPHRIIFPVLTWSGSLFLYTQQISATFYQESIPKGGSVKSGNTPKIPLPEICFRISFVPPN